MTGCNEKKKGTCRKKKKRHWKKQGKDTNHTQKTCNETHEKRHFWTLRRLKKKKGRGNDHPHLGERKKKGNECTQSTIETPTRHEKREEKTTEFQPSIHHTSRSIQDTHRDNTHAHNTKKEGAVAKSPAASCHTLCPPRLLQSVHTEGCVTLSRRLRSATGTSSHAGGARSPRAAGCAQTLRAPHRSCRAG